MPHHEQGWFEPKYNDTTRIVVNYGGALRPIFWFSVGDDQSVYLGPRAKRPTNLRYGQSGVRTDQGVRISYDEGEVLDLSEIANPAKISFHQSGIVNAPSGRSVLGPKEVAGGQLLAHLLFQHPREFEVIESPRTTDVVLNIEIDDDAPLIGRLVKMQGRLGKAAQIDGSDLQIDLTFEYPETSVKPKFTTLLTLYTGPRGPWPPNNYIVWPAGSS